ncbi:MAG: glycoside hydrolase family 25 protein [Saprospiraceae bacterium]|nr:glycoside hydrolase family 25 protein [Saprospiraceae bacterium]
MNKNTVILLFFMLALMGCESDTQRLKGYEVHGIDISHYQSNVQWDVVAAQGISFAFVKATEGKQHIDKEFQRNWEQMRQHGIKRGAYHFFRPSVDGEVQARNFIQSVDMRYGDLPPVLDIEIDEDLPREVVVRQMRAWLYWVELEYSIKPIIYTSYKFYNKFIVGEFEKYPIWIAKYGGDAPRLGASKWWFWQYGNRGKLNGIDGYVDFNVFYGSREELERICLSGAMLSGLISH